MNDTALRRLRSQRLIGAGLSTPVDAVHWLGAVQSQDFSGAKWAVGMRVRGATESDVERAYNDGAILRTHMLRPTWHFATRADIRWLLELTAPRVHAQNNGRCRQLKLDIATFRKSQAALRRALQGGDFKTRDELRDVLARSGVPTDNTDQRMAYIMMNAELDAVVCSGPRRGKQFTYALLDERAPSTKSMDRQDALVELARRFFSSRGPATAQDLAKWSGLTVADAKFGAENCGLERDTTGKRTSWFAVPAVRPKPARPPLAHLLSIYDEYVSGYKDRSALVAREHGIRLIAKGAALAYIVVINGQIIGTWRREFARDSAAVDIELYVRLAPNEERAVKAEAQRFAEFFGLPKAITTLSRARA